MKNGTTIITEDETAILEHLIEPSRGNLPKGVARYFLTLEFPRDDIERINDLSAKARAGALTTREGDLLDSYLRISALVSIMKSKARRSLKAAEESH